jgi:hypothetical protein
MTAEGVEDVGSLREREPGDRLIQERRFHGYPVSDTKFAGPTMGG